ncbi:hypothetical protein M758_UG055300 [Ceratodon purpureus]|nr:hypothetical protein M758_UG055300 [Ceratodon purpureus]
MASSDVWWAWGAVWVVVSGTLSAGASRVAVSVDSSVRALAGDYFSCAVPMEPEVNRDIWKLEALSGITFKSFLQNKITSPLAVPGHVMPIRSTWVRGTPPILVLMRIQWLLPPPPETTQWPSTAVCVAEGSRRLL